MIRLTRLTRETVRIDGSFRWIADVFVKAISRKSLDDPNLLKAKTSDACVDQFDILIGALLAFGVTEAIGLAAAVFPNAWLQLFSDEPAMLDAGRTYLRIVGPIFGCFGIGLSLYLAPQGAGRLGWALIGGSARSSLQLAAAGWH